ncbi:hypothetical protein TruAng_002834 [Truncatella angustata]|nr:hypothetical protein TruAng_002834 [Truncatella angustata]
MTFLFQYFRIFRQIQFMRNTYLIAMVVVVAWNIGQLISITFVCLPVAGFWDKTIDATCMDQRVLVYINAAGNMVTDIIIIMLPLPALWKLHLPRAQKIAVFGVFGVGSITVVISIIRLTTIHTDKIEDFTYDVWTSACFSVAELASGITCAALATMRPLIGHFFPFLFSHSHGTTIQYNPDDRHPPTIGSAHSDKKTKQLRGDEEKAWAADIYDADLGGFGPSMPGTPRKNSSTVSRYQEETDSIKAFQMLKPRMGSVTSIMSPRFDGRPTFLDMDEAPRNTSVKIGIKIEREFEVRESRSLSNNA